jgi:hypothetical protein
MIPPRCVNRLAAAKRGKAYKGFGLELKAKTLLKVTRLVINTELVIYMEGTVNLFLKNQVIYYSPRDEEA